MKILFVTEFFPIGKDLRFSGGVEARTFFVARQLAKKHKVYVIASKTPGAKPFEKINNIHVYRAGETRKYSASAGYLISRIKYIISAINLGRSLDADIVDGGNYISHFIAKKISQKKRIPVVAWYPDVWLGNWIKNAGVYGVFGEVLERYNMRSKFDTYIAISNQTANKLKKYTRKKINVIYCGVDKKEFNNKVSKFKNPTIICVSRLAKYKNIKSLIYAFSFLEKRLHQCRLIIVGTGPQEHKLKSLTKELQIAKKVSFFKNLARKDLIRLYLKSHLFSLPSSVEGFGIATIEAAAADLPYVNNNSPIHKEVTKNGLGGFLINSSNYENFSDKLYQLLNNRKLYEQKSKDAEKLAEYYNWHEIANHTEKIYFTLLRNYED